MKKEVLRRCFGIAELTEAQAARLEEEIKTLLFIGLPRRQAEAAAAWCLGPEFRAEAEAAAEARLVEERPEALLPRREPLRVSEADDWQVRPDPRGV